MDRKVSFIVALISDFAERFGLTTPQAYRYLALYKGIDFLDEFYDVERTLSFDDVVKDVALLCRNNGGALACYSITAPMWTLSRSGPSNS